jgi:starch-binding outer membrane protein, SusD/RagB family
MKLKNIFSWIALSSVIAFSCDVLEQEPETQISDQGAFTNEKSADAALAGLYHQMQSGGYYGRNFQIISDVSADIAQSIGTWDFYREMDTYALDASNTELNNFYIAGYRTVNQANNLIASVPGIEMPQAKRDNLVGQAYFARALAFFDLNRTFGGVPGKVGTKSVVLPLEPSRGAGPATHLARPDLAVGYAQVKSDLLQAISLLPEAQASDAFSRSRAVKSTARALLSRLHLYLGEWDDVITTSTAVINDSRYSLVADYANIFSGKLTTESIFEIEFNNADQSGIRNWYLPSTGGLGGRGDLAMHTDFVNLIRTNPTDVRGAMFGFNAAQGVFFPLKYQKPGNIDNVHVLRISEMFLNRAEAHANKNSIALAVADLNRIRNRAGLANYNGAMTQAAVLLAIEQERAIEFHIEGHRFFDLVRTGRALAVLSAVRRTNSSVPIGIGEAFKQIMPIPRVDLLANPNLVQNQGYGN